jgi:general secretion pathway protein C
MLALVMAAALGDVAAVGAVISSRPGASVAVLRCGGRVRVVAEGERACGARLVSVAADRVTLEADGSTHEVRLARAISAPAAPAAPAAEPSLPPPLSTPSPGEPLAVERALARDEVQRRLALEIPRILGETAVRPVSEDGRVTGLQLVRVASGTLLTELGLRPGDVLTQINGTPTDSLPTLMALWSRLQGASALHATVLRDGRPVELSVTLR